MTTAWKYWTESIAQRLSEQLNIAVSPHEIVRPPDQKLGDFAFGCFRLAKERKQNPAEVASEIAKNFSTLHMDLTNVTAVGPYVNFLLSTGDAVHRVVGEVEKLGEKYGENDMGKGQQLILEYAQPNTHKELHVGHLRNFVLGSSLVRLEKISQWKVISASYHGDVGAHVAKCLWWLVKKMGGDISDLTEKKVDSLLKIIPETQKNGQFLGEMYTESTTQLEEHPDFKTEVSLVQKKLEAHDPIWEILWRETRRWSLEEMAHIFDDLDVRIERQYLESEVVDRGQSIVDDLLRKGIARESEGAIIVDLEDKKLGIFLIRKSDGTSLYATKELALAELKIKEYPLAHNSLLLVDSRQSFYFKQLFETLHLMGTDQKYTYVGYELVTLKDGAMSSRKGNIVTYQALHDAVIDYARAEILKRHADWTEGKVTHTAWALAMAGMKFAMLRQDNDRIFTFDMKEALSFDGATGPYCQYAATRLASILKKANVKLDISKTLTRDFQHATEKALALSMAQLPEMIVIAARDYRPSVIAQWCHELAQRINDFYRDVPVLEAKGETLEGRLRLAEAARQTLARGLELLGIPLPDEM